MTHPEMPEDGALAAVQDESAADATAYLPETPFNPDDDASYYTVEIDQTGPIVYSECCSDRISLSTARLLHEALGRWLTDQPGGTPRAGAHDGEGGGG
ncbi:hypothetical protein ABZ543_08355 [Streptomyces roseifaciens]